MKLKLSPTMISWVFSLLTSVLGLSSPAVSDAPEIRLCGKPAVLRMAEFAFAQQSNCRLAMKR